MPFEIRLHQVSVPEGRERLARALRVILAHAWNPEPEKNVEAMGAEGDAVNEVMTVVA